MFRQITVAAVMVAASSALAADSGVTRKLFDRMDVPANYETVIGSAEIASGANIGRHTHHGTEFGYVAQGELELIVDGKPTQHVKAGSFYKIDAGVVHDARGVGGTTVAIATWVIEKGKPLAEPAK